MSADAFIDTNVLIYQLETTDPRKHRIAETIIRDAVSTGSACISFQVVQECLNTALRKALIRLDAAAAQAYLDAVLIPLTSVLPSAALYRNALRLQARWQFNFYDCLIVAAALEAGCSRLLTEDMQDGQRIDGLRIENPFKA